MIAAASNTVKLELPGSMSISNVAGVSRTALMRHLTNASANVISPVEGALPAISTDEWEANESLAVPLFKPQDVPVSRRGRFAHYVYEAHRRKAISDDTAASLFRCKPEHIAQALRRRRNWLHNALADL